ncbi:hypothetical protein DMN91_004030 [Ooceraea biroi]|uniref:Uncharacterized protein n=1 Tax=Ooceraea biroi TaxID=2015173 RepID=A0A3L8DU55_OOCBI|nr:hypothetical protein DMN91_004030 [Ooceraea biroi]
MVVGRLKCVISLTVIEFGISLLYSWKSDDTVGTFVAGLKVIARKIEALESVDFGNKLNEKLLMAKILGCLPKDYDNCVISWSLLSIEMSLEAFLEKLANRSKLASTPVI